MQARVGLATNTKAPFEAEGGNVQEEPKLESAPEHSINPPIAGEGTWRRPGYNAISRRRPGHQVRHPCTSAFIGKLHELLKGTSKASHLRGQVAALPVR